MRVILKTEIYLTVAEDVNKAYGTFDENRAAKRIPSFSFSSRKKDGMIPGFFEGLNLMSYGDKVVLFTF
jgi:hypothetical protein